MVLSERQSQICALVRDQGYLTVETLAQRLGVTGQTIRRDLQKLADLGLLRRRHGGVEYPGHAPNLAYSARRGLNVAAKSSIARAVADYVPNGASLAFGIGTTPEFAASAFRDHRDLRIFTNNLNVAGAACGNASFEVTVPGGRLRNADLDILGPATETFFSAYNVDYGVFGVGGVEQDGSLLDFHEDEVRTREAILRNCRTSLLIVDSSKFGRPAHVRGGHISQIAVVVSDARPPEAIAAILDRSGVELIVADERRRPEAAVAGTEASP